MRQARAFCAVCGKPMVAFRRETGRFSPFSGEAQWEIGVKCSSGEVDHDLPVTLGGTHLSRETAEFWVP
jgi:hypothetical protein